MIDALLPFVGFIVGLLVGLSGIGAGAIMTPVLLALGVPPIFAVGTDLLHASLSKAVGFALYLRKNLIDLRVLSGLVSGSVVALLLSGYLIVLLKSFYGVSSLNLLVGICIAILLIISGLFYLFAPRPRMKDVKHDGNDMSKFSSYSTIGFAIGLAVSLTSIGAGSLLMPFLLKKMRLVKAVVGTDLAYGFLFSLMAGILQFSLGHVLLGVVLLLLLGSLPGIYLGVTINNRVSVGQLKSVLAVLILIAGITSLIKILLK